MDMFQAARLMAQLPRESRLYRKAADDEIGYEGHVLLGVLDACRTGAYYSMIAAQGAVDKKHWSKVIAKAPKPIPRPGQAPEPEPERVAEYVHPRDALKAVNRMIHNMAFTQVMGGG